MTGNGSIGKKIFQEGLHDQMSNAADRSKKLRMRFDHWMQQSGIYHWHGYKQFQWGGMGENFTKVLHTKREINRKKGELLEQCPLILKGRKYQIYK